MLEVGKTQQFFLLCNHREPGCIKPCFCFETFSISCATAVYCIYMEGLYDTAISATTLKVNTDSLKISLVHFSCSELCTTVTLQIRNKTKWKSDKVWSVHSKAATEPAKSSCDQNHKVEIKVHTMLIFLPLYTLRTMLVKTITTHTGADMRKRLHSTEHFKFLKT